MTIRRKRARLVAASLYVVACALNTVAAYHALGIKYPDNGGD